MNKTFEITVTPEIVDESLAIFCESRYELASQRCPIALAVHRAVDPAAGIGYDSFKNMNTGEIFESNTRDFICRFDTLIGSAPDSAAAMAFKASYTPVTFTYRQIA